MFYSPFKKVEVCPLSSTGLPGTCTVLAAKLPVGVAYGRAVAVGRFIYLVGGHSGGSSVLASVYRAQVLISEETSCKFFTLESPIATNF